MSPEQIAELKEILEQMQKETLDHLRATLEEGSEQKLYREVVGDSLDESNEEYMASTELRLRDRERYLLAKIEESLERIEEGEYPYCDDCGDPIGYTRLKARPVAQLCISCKEEQEEQEKHLRAKRPVYAEEDSW